MDLKKLIEPKSVAVFGASSKRVNPGRMLLENYQKCGCDVYAVSTSSGVVPGFKTVRNVAELPEVVDLAVIALPKVAVKPTLQQLMEQNKSKSIQIITAGFEEFGDDSLKKYAQIQTIPIQGSNIAGNVSKGNNYTFLNTTPARDVGATTCVISQSGAFLTSVAKELPVKYGFGIGNQSGLRFLDYLQFCCETGAETVVIYSDKLSGSDYKGIARLARRYRNISFILYEGAQNKSSLAAAALHSGSKNIVGVERPQIREKNVIKLSNIQTIIDRCRFNDLRTASKTFLALTQSGFVSTRIAGHLKAGSLSDQAKKQLQSLIDQQKIPAHISAFLDATPQASPAVFFKMLLIYLEQLKIAPERAEGVCLSILPELFNQDQLNFLVQHLNGLSDEEKNKLLVFVESDQELAAKVRKIIPNTFFRADSLTALSQTTPDGNK